MAYQERERREKKDKRREEERAGDRGGYGLWPPTSRIAIWSGMKSRAPFAILGLRRTCAGGRGRAGQPLL